MAFRDVSAGWGPVPDRNCAADTHLGRKTRCDRRGRIRGQADPGGRYLNLDLPLMNYFLAQNIPVYGVETSDVDYSYMKQYQKLNVSTVDNIEMIPGQLSLVMAVYGKPGNYGIKTTARQLMPGIP